MDSARQQLLNMGFPSEQVTQALSNGRTLDQAIEFLLGGGDGIVSETSGDLLPPSPTDVAPVAPVSSPHVFNYADEGSNNENSNPDDLASGFTPLVRSDSAESISTHTGDNNNREDDDDSALPPLPQRQRRNGVSQEGVVSHAPVVINSDSELEDTNLNQIEIPELTLEQQEMLKRSPYDLDYVHIEDTLEDPGQAQHNLTLLTVLQNVSEDGMFRMPDAAVAILEQAVFQLHSWKIPIQRNEALGICLQAAIRALDAPDALTADPQLNNFLTNVMPEAFGKLLESDAVLTWRDNVLSQIQRLNNIALRLCIKLIPFDHPVVVTVLRPLFTTSSNFNLQCNSHLRDQPVDIPDDFELYAVGRSNYTKQWRVDNFNWFCNCGGFDVIDERFNRDDLTLDVVHSLLKCFTKLDIRLTDYGRLRLSPVFLRALVLLKDDNLAASNHQATSESLDVLFNFGSDAVKADIVALRLRRVDEALDNESFTKRMDALKELIALTESCFTIVSHSYRLDDDDDDILDADAAVAADSVVRKGSVDCDRLIRWITQHRVIERAIKEFLHHAQYVERLRDIVWFVSRNHALTLDQLASIWDAQSGQHQAIVKNIQELLTHLSYDLSAEMLSHLLDCFRGTWEELVSEGDARNMEDALEFIVKLAYDDREGQMATKVLELLWQLAIDEAPPLHIRDTAIRAQARILNAATHDRKLKLKHTWLERCIEGLKQKQDVVSCLTLLGSICEYCSRAALRADSVVTALQTAHDICLLLANSVHHWWLQAQQFASQQPNEDPDTVLLDFLLGGYPYAEAVDRHLIAFYRLLLACKLQANWGPIQQLWECLFLQASCDAERNLLMAWLKRHLSGHTIVVSKKARQQLFLHGFQTVPVESFTHAVAEVYGKLFVDVNVQAGLFSSRGGFHYEVKETKAFGWEKLWQIGLESHTRKVQETAALLLGSCFNNFSYSLRTKHEGTHPLAMEVANRFLREAVALGLAPWDEHHAVNQVMKDAGKTFLVYNPPLYPYDDDDDDDDDDVWSKTDNRVRFEGAGHQDVEMQNMTSKDISSDDAKFDVPNSVNDDDSATPNTGTGGANTAASGAAGDVVDGANDDITDDVERLEATLDADKAKGAPVEPVDASGNADNACGVSDGTGATVEAQIADAVQAEPANSEAPTGTAQSDESNPAKEDDAANSGKRAMPTPVSSNTADSVAADAALDAIQEEVRTAPISPVVNIINDPKPCPPKPVGPGDLVLSLHRAGRALQLLQQVLTKEDDKHSGVRLEPPHKYSARGDDLTLTISPRMGQEKVLIRTHSHAPLVFIRKQVAAKFHQRAACTQLMLHTDTYLGTDRNCLSLAQLNITRNTELDTYVSYNTSGVGSSARPTVKNPAGDIAVPLSSPTRVQAEQMLASSALSQHAGLRQAVYALLCLDLSDINAELAVKMSVDSFKRLRDHAIQLLQQLPNDHSLLQSFEAACLQPPTSAHDCTPQASEASTGDSATRTTNQEDALPLNVTSDLHTLLHAPLRLQAPPDVNEADAGEAHCVALWDKINAKTSVAPSLLKYRLEVLQALLSPAYVCSKADCDIRHEARSNFVINGVVDILARLMQMTFPATDSQDERAVLQAICSIALTLICDLLRQAFNNRQEHVEPIRGSAVGGSGGLTIEEAAETLGPIISYRLERDPITRLPIVPEYAHSAAARYYDLDLPEMVAMQTTVDWQAVGEACKLLLWKALTCQWSAKAIPATLDAEGVKQQHPHSPNLVTATAQLLMNLLDLRLIRIELLGVDGSHCRFVTDGLLHGHNAGMRRRFSSLLTKAIEQHEDQCRDVTISSRYAMRRRCLDMLLTAPLPFWSFDADTGLHTDEWFSCVAQLVKGLGNCFQADPSSSSEAPDISLDNVLLCNREVDWIAQLLDRCEAESVALDEVPGGNLRGHINLLCAFLGPCSSARKAEIGVDQGLLGRLLQQCLFPSAVAVANERLVTTSCAIRRQMTRSSLFELLASLCCGSAENTALVQNWIETYVLSNIVSDGFDWDPDCPGRRTHVGLRNGGATCYMNSVLQQLYMQPMLRYALLEVPEAIEAEYASKQDPPVDEEDAAQAALTNGDDSKSGDHLESLVSKATIKPLLKSDLSLTKVDVKPQLRDSIVFHLQRIFANLQGLKQQHYTPVGFWKTFRLWGDPVNIHRQDDAAAFFQNVIDQADEQLASLNQPKVFSPLVKFSIANQKIGRSCPHRHENVSPSANLEVVIDRQRNLSEAMNEFVKGELMSGVNQYKCSTCDANVDALARTCIKTLPPTLVVQLKRFSYDYQTMQALKNNDHFEFPAQFDFGPYTAEGLSRRESARDSPDNQDEKVASSCSEYQLQGVVVHMGTATAGHYYSYARTRETPETRANKTANQWYKFNDETIEPVTLDADLFEDQFYGGDTTRSSMYGVMDKNYSAYILVYERKDVLEHLKTGGQTMQQLHRQLSRCTSIQEEDPPLDDDDATLSEEVQPSSPGPASSELTIPPRLQLEIDAANLRFGFNSELLSGKLATFVASLVREASVNPIMAKSVSQLATNMFFKVACHLHGNAIKDRKARLTELQEPMIELFRGNQTARREACHILAQHPEWLQACLLDCKLMIVRSICAELTLYAISLQGDFSVQPDDPDWLSVLSHLGNILPGFQQQMDRCGPYIKLVADFLRGTVRQRMLAINSGLVDACMQFVGTRNERGETVWKYEDHNRMDDLHLGLCYIIRSCDLTPLHLPCDIKINEPGPDPVTTVDLERAEALLEEAAQELVVSPESEKAEKDKEEEVDDAVRSKIALPEVCSMADRDQATSPTSPMVEGQSGLPQDEVKQSVDPNHGQEAGPNPADQPAENIANQPANANTGTTVDDAADDRNDVANDRRANVSASPTSPEVDGHHSAESNVNETSYGPEPEPSKWSPSTKQPDISPEDLAAIQRALEDDDDSVVGIPDLEPTGSGIVLPPAVHSGQTDTLPSYKSVVAGHTELQPLSTAVPLPFMTERTENPMLLVGPSNLSTLPACMMEGALGDERWYIKMILKHLLTNHSMPRVLTCLMHDDLGLSMFILRALMDELRDPSYHTALKALATFLSHRDTIQSRRFSAVAFGTDQFPGLFGTAYSLIQSEHRTAYKYFKMIPQLMASVPAFEHYIRERSSHLLQLMDRVEHTLPTNAVHSVNSNCYGEPFGRLQRTTSFSNTMRTVREFAEGRLPLVNMSLMMATYASAASV
eukprot:m.291041 g.291041  ORF g.291041 m.291041 type:complete len:3212 (-) comp17811_c0_seq4:1418-11053(-)